MEAKLALLVVFLFALNLAFDGTDNTAYASGKTLFLPYLPT